MGLDTTTVVCVASTTRVGVLKRGAVAVALGIRVGNNAPGVRITLIQSGWLRMSESTGSTNPPGRRVRKSLFGSRFDPRSAFNFQLGGKRTAQDPTTNTHMNPIRMITAITIQSRRSCSDTFTGVPIDRQPHKDRRAGICRFVEARAFKPDTAAMCINYAACDGKSQARAATPKFGFAR